MERVVKDALCPEYIVNFDNVSKSYTTTFSRKRTSVLNNINLTITSGSIFGLLGPSGCGKTTLLKCVIGCLKPDSGIVSVFRHFPGTPESGIPGKRIGYMPQDVALTEELSVSETLRFFGRVMRMSSKNINNRVEFLLKLLQMDAYQRKTLNNLSGGQKRRVSFAVALLHEPQLLILDEPTVGVDPLLRQNIWKHLYTLASLSGVTILVTTHYIEEARMAHNVGLMLNGRILIQSSPQDVMQQFDSSSLEEAFVNVCLREEQTSKQQDGLKTSLMTSSNCAETSLLNISSDEPICDKKPNHSPFSTNFSYNSSERNSRLFSFHRLMALTVKTFVFSIRHPAAILLQLVVTPLTFGVFALSIGKAPYGIEVAVVNADNSKLSQYYFDLMNKHSLNLIPYPSYEEAIRGIENGFIYGAIYLNPNFTEAVLHRFSHTVLTDDAVISNSRVQVALDVTNKQVALTISHEVMETFHKYATSLLNRMGLNPALADIPIQYHGDVTEVLGVELDQFLLPGFMICIIFFMSLGTTAINHLSDKQLGSVDRLRVSGITDFELIFSQLISQTVVLMLLVPLVFVAVFLVLGFNIQGSVLLAAILNILQGICGLSEGLLVASVTDQLTTAIVLCLAMFFVAIMIQGVIWPLESLPYFFRYISVCLPSTYPVLAMRSIVNHSCGITCLPVIFGLLSSCMWITAFLLISWTALRLRSQL